MGIEGRENILLLFTLSMLNSILQCCRAHPMGERTRAMVPAVRSHGGVRSKASHTSTRRGRACATGYATRVLCVCCAPSSSISCAGWDGERLRKGEGEGEGAMRGVHLEQFALLA